MGHRLPDRAPAGAVDRKAAAISLLVAIGVRTDGQKVLLAVKSMGGETTEAWRAVLDIGPYALQQFESPHMHLHRVDRKLRCIGETRAVRQGGRWEGIIPETLACPCPINPFGSTNCNRLNERRPVTC